jgi:hypothetical protein
MNLSKHLFRADVDAVAIAVAIGEFPQRIQGPT